MNKFLNFKKGTEKILSIYWFAILIIISVGVIAMVYIFYNYPYDVRELEVDILTDKVADCLSYGGKLNPDLLNEKETFNENFKNGFLKECNLNFSVENFSVEKGYEWKKMPQYYIEINFYILESLENSVFNIVEGNENWKANCDFKPGIDLTKKEFERLPKCIKKRFYALGENNRQYLIEILSIVGKVEKNVKI